MQDTGDEFRGKEQGLARPANAEPPLSKPEQWEAARAKWRDAARNFTGPGARLEARPLLTGITRNQHGYQIRLVRGEKVVFSRYVNGFSEESLLEAIRLRDQGLRELRRRGLRGLRRKRVNAIPVEVLRALGLSSPVVGVSRLESRSCYRVGYRNADGTWVARNFYYRRVPEAVAYAAAIAFLQQRLERQEPHKTGGRF